MKSVYLNMELSNVVDVQVICSPSEFCDVNSAEKVTKVKMWQKGKCCFFGKQLIILIEVVDCRVGF